MNEQNQNLKKERMTRYFIDSVIQLSKVQPVSSITLRDVAKEAGFNSATLYRYFKNMNQLFAFTILDLISAIWIEDSRREKSITDPLQQYLSLWEVQCELSFHNPHLFLSFYLMKNKQEVYDCAADYFSVFPKRKEQISPRFLSQLQISGFKNKNLGYLRPCVEAGYLSEKDQEMLIQVTDILFGGTLLQVLRHQEEPDCVQEMTHRFLYYLDQFLSSRLLKPKTYDPFFLDKH